MSILKTRLAALLCALAAAGASAGNLTLSESQLECSGSAKAALLKDGSLSLRIDNPKGDASLRLLPPKGEAAWDLASWKYLAMDVENLSKERQLRLNFALKSPSQDKKSQEEVFGVALNPGEKRTLRVELPHQWLRKTPEGVPGPKALDTAKISVLTFFLQWPFEKASPRLADCKIEKLRLEQPLTPDSSAAPAAMKGFFPFIDPYGQNVHAQWPEKIRSPKDLKDNFAAEAKELAASKPPEDWDKFGGWKSGPQLEATGSFRVEKFDGKWNLVDPEGKLFFSHGLDVLIAHTDAMKVPGHESWFASVPEGVKSWQPVDGNLQIKYGKEDYLPEFYATLAKRLPHWGFNSVGDWGAHRLMELGKVPYTLQLTDFDYKMPKIGKLKFYDVFAPAYIEKMRNLVALAAQKEPFVEKSLTDPYCIGYFIDNELNFGERKYLPYLNEIMRSPATLHTKVKFVESLKERYGEIEKLNETWKRSYKSWDELLASVEVPESEGYLADAKDFFKVVLDQYFSLCREAVKSAAPNRLYLGCRFIGTDAVRPELYSSCAKYADVLSVNIYAHTPANFPTPAEGFPDIPVIIGEFHFGVAGRGMFSPGLCIAGNNEEERALAYVRFVQGALAHPNIVGAHWFQFRDQPLTGRWDGEGYQIGFVDVADTPYKEMTEASRKLGERMYRYRAEGKLRNSLDQER